MSEEPSETERGFDEVVEVTRAKILHTLSIFPALSATMIQTGIGTSLSPRLWRPILIDLVKEGEVIEAKVNSTTPHDRQQVYTVYHLRNLEYDNIRSILAPKPNTQAA